MVHLFFLGEEDFLIQNPKLFYREWAGFPEIKFPLGNFIKEESSKVPSNDAIHSLFTWRECVLFIWLWIKQFKQVSGVWKKLVLLERTFGTNAKASRENIPTSLWKCKHSTELLACCHFHFIYWLLFGFCLIWLIWFLYHKKRQIYLFVYMWKV